MPYCVIVLDAAKHDLKKMNKSITEMFVAHFEKLANYVPGKHMKFGLPFFSEKVTKQARFLFDVEENNTVIKVVRCFKSHKEYETWYKSFR